MRPVDVKTTTSTNAPSSRNRMTDNDRRSYIGRHQKLLLHMRRYEKRSAASTQKWPKKCCYDLQLLGRSKFIFGFFLRSVATIASSGN